MLTLFLSGLAAHHENSVDSQFPDVSCHVEAIRNPATATRRPAKVRHQLYTAQALCAINRHAEAVPLLRQLTEGLRANALAGACLVDEQIVRTLIQCLLLSNDLSEAARLVVEQHLRRPGSTRTLPVADILTKASSPPSTRRTLPFQYSISLLGARTARLRCNTTIVSILFRSNDPANYIRLADALNAIYYDSFLDRVAPFGSSAVLHDFAATDDLEAERTTILRYLAKSATLTNARLFDQNCSK